MSIEWAMIICVFIVTVGFLLCFGMWMDFKSNFPNEQKEREGGD